MTEQSGGSGAGLAAIALVVGGAIGFGVGASVSGGEGVPATSPVAAESPASPAPVGSESAVATSPEVAPTVAVDVPATPVATPPSGGGALAATLEAALRDLPALPDRSAPSITGTVRTLDGSPVPTVTIKALAWEKEPKSTPAEDGPPSLGEALKSAATQHRWVSEMNREVTTDAEGKFEVTGLSAACNYSINGEAEGWEVTVGAGGFVFGHEPGATVNMVAERRVGLEIEVVGPDGQPVEEAMILFHSGSYGLEELWTPTTTVHCKSGLHRLSAASQDRELASDPQVVSVSLDAAPPKLRFQLSSRPGIKGKVKLPEDELAPYLTVWLLPVTPGTTPDPQLLRESQTQTSVGAGDVFRFGDLAAGSYAIGVGRSWNEVSSIQVVDVVDSMVEVTVEIPPTDPARALIVRPYGPGRAPLSDAQVELYYDTHEGMGEVMSSVDMIKKIDGSLWIVPYDMATKVLSGELDGTVHVNVISEQYGSRRLQVRSGSSETSVHFDAPALIEAQISGYQGSGSEGLVQLSLVEKTDREDMEFFSPFGNQLGADGSQTFGPLQPGRYELKLMVKLGEYQFMPAATRELNVTPGHKIERIDLPPLYPLEVQFDPNENPGQVSLSPDTGEMDPDGMAMSMSMASVEVDPETGVAKFGRVPVGSYKLEAWGPEGPGTMLIDVSGPTQVAFKSQVTNALQVVLTDPAGFLSQLGLEHGDLLIGIDGEEFENMMQMQMLFMNSAASGVDATVRVLRGDKVFELPINLGSLMQPPDALGGELTPASR